MKLLLVLFVGFSVSCSVGRIACSLADDGAAKPVKAVTSNVIRDFDSIKQAVSIAFN